MNLLIYTVHQAYIFPPVNMSQIRFVYVLKAYHLLKNEINRTYKNVCSVE